ncbi:EMILIN-1 Elastin microfibril interface-located protein 1 [Collichthys lucidus]|uniref:EMILIN-1 Elastin microfibril interface-located protein 1 n=1 Tax=Collichthys lucidus TaxID=240159 RepID=A0A4U5TUM9_COLLU|nr:EMILIN-1 Elastin microfibril interface-located protein 1 [Collichthys lucidus]
MGALLLLLLALSTCGHAKSAFPLRSSYSLYAGGHAQAHAARAASRHRYRTYMRPRYKVAYKMVTEMEWKCCQGYSGEDCNDGPAGGTGSQISSTRPQPRPGQGGGMSYGQGAGGQGGGGTRYGQEGRGSGGGSSGSGQSGGHIGRVENEKMRQMEEKIQSLTKNLQDLQSTMNTMNEHFQQGVNKPGFSGGGPSSGGRNPADAAQPEIKETIHSIQTKLDQLDNRTQAHDKTLVNINNHLVNGKGNDLDGGLSGGGLSGGKLNLLKEEILRELERRVSLSCSSCQAGVEDLRRQQQEDRERIRALEKQLNAMDVRYRQGLDGLRREVARSQGCCDTVSDLQNRITDAERKISSASENLDVLQNRLDKVLSGESGSSNNNENDRFRGGFSGGIEGGGRDVVLTENRLDNRLKELERRINNTVQRTEQSCSYLENDLKDYFHRELGDLRTVFLDRFDDQAYRIADVELDVGLVKDRVSDHDKRLSKLENNTSILGQRLEECSCSRAEGGGKSSTPGDRGKGGGRWEGGDGGDDNGGAGGHEGGSTGEGTTGGGKRGGLSGMGGQKENTTEKSLEWRVVANEDQIRHFNTQLKDLSVSGDSLHNKIKSLTGDHGEHFNRIVTEVELLGQDCELCGKVEEELQRLKNHSQDALGRMQSHINRLQIRLDSGKESCYQTCSHLEDEVHLLRDDVRRCTVQCKNSPEMPTGGGGSGGTGVSSGRRPGLDSEKPLDGHSVIGGSLNNNQLKTLQGELSEVILTFSSINDTLKGLEHTVQKHGSVITDLGEHSSKNTASLHYCTFVGKHSLIGPLTGNTKDKIISELDKIQQEVTEHVEDSRDRLDGMDRDVRRFENTLLVEMGDCKRSGDGLEKRLSKLEGVCGRLDGVSDSILKIKDGLNQHVSSLWTCVSGLNDSVIHHGGIMDFIQKNQDDVYSRMKNLNTSLNQVLKDIQSFSEHNLTGIPGIDAHVPRLSFSAALTVPMERAGTIVFDKIFVNEGDFYDPRTGIFTAPVDGHYFFSAILTGHKNEKIEAVLSKSNYGMARVDSGGYQPEGLENNPVAEAKTIPGSLAVFNIILPLQTRDTVCIDLVMGKLAHSVEPLTIFSGMLLYEDM